MNLSRKQKIYYIILPCFGAVLIGFLIGFLSGYLPKRNNDNGNNSGQNGNNVDNNLLKYYESLVKDIDESYFTLLQNEIKADNLRNYLKNMTMKPHLAGTAEDWNSAQYVYNNWIEQKLDYVKIIDYDVFLSYPDENVPNNIQFLDSSGEVKQTIEIVEPILDPGLNYSGAPFPFLGYAPNGSITAEEVYYVNFCSEQDFQFFTRNLSIDVTGKTVMCRYGNLFRGNKIEIAAKNGAKAVILYSDPLNFAPDDVKDQIYPNGIYLPEYGTQRGTLFTGSGDPQTPIYPSTEDAFRSNEDDVKGIPKIIAQVIPYKDAKSIFDMLEENVEVKSDWAGALKTKYTYGGKLSNQMQLRVNVFNQRKISRTYNVIGMIKGSIEPDRYVMIGNHRDAWVLGSLDPTSGTASLLEMSRALSVLKNTHGWQPRRSILFLSWGAEEYGLLGSTEWVEEFNKKLSANAVAYLNLDISVEGNYSYVAYATPVMNDLIFDVTKKVYITNNETVFDRWLKYSPNEDNTLPDIDPDLGAGSDHMAFQQRVGVPCIDAWFDPEKSSGSSYPLYHTNYETFRLIDEFVDPGFNSFRVISIVTAEIARQLSDSLILPINAINYATHFTNVLQNLKKEYGDELQSRNISLNGIEKAISNYASVSKNFHQRLNAINKTYITLVNQYNEQLRNLEKSFLVPEFIEREGFMHVISAPSLYDQYASDGFPGLSDAIYQAIYYPKDPISDWDKVRKQLSIVIYAINSASTVLDVPDRFERTF